MRRGVCAVVGAQFGSEGKGLIVGHVAKEYGHHVRVGAANAGHTLYTVSGIPSLGLRTGPADRPFGVNRNTFVAHKHVMQQLPCAAYANPEALLYIGPGALISPEILAEEIRINEQWRKERRLPVAEIYVDPRAHVITQAHIDQEAMTDLAERIGSTSTIAREGIGAAQAARAMRTGYVTAEEYYDGIYNTGDGIVLADVPVMLHNAATRGGGVLMEGTQGTGLSNTTGFYPYVTSRNTTAAGLLADVGLAPSLLHRVILVARTYPIRVAGPSGPFFPGSREIGWDEIGVDPENERTTVTKKIRRVATFSIEQLKHAARINGATEVALTFADYIEPELARSQGAAGMGELGSYEQLQSLMDDVIDATGCPIGLIGTGPHHVVEWLPEGACVEGHEAA